MIRIGSRSGQRGRFAMMYDSDTMEPIATGLTCKDFKSTKQSAIDWAKAEFGSDWERHCDFKEEE